MKSNLKNKKGERVAVGDGKRAKKQTLAPSLEGRGWGWVIKIINIILKDKKMKKISIIFASVLIFSMFFQVIAFSSPNSAPNTCSSGVYPISSSISRGIQRFFGINILTTWAAEAIIKNQISKLIQKGSVKVNVQAYSAGDLLAGKVKSFEISGKNLVYNDIYISSVKAQSLCDFTYFDYKKTPAMLNSPLFLKYEAEIKNKEFQKIFASDALKDALQGIPINVGFFKVGEVDITNIKPSIANNKINMKADLVYKKTPFVFKFPISFETAIKIKNDKILLTNFKFTTDNESDDLKFITNSIELNNINIFDLKTVEKEDSDINVKKIKVVNDKIFIEGTFWQQQNTTF